MQAEYQYYLEFLQQIHPLKTESIEAILPILSQRTYLKKELLVHQGEVSTELYFILSGCVREYFENEEADEINTWFGFENSIAISNYSLFSQKPSLTNIQALEDLKTIVVKYDDLQTLYDKFHDIERLGRILAEQYLVQIEEMKVILQSLSARKRYEYLLNNRPELVQRIPLKHLASFLGIQLETLSRVRQPR